MMWNATGRFSGQALSFVIQIIIARLLIPDDYGLIGMVAIFFAVSQVFIDSGFTSALIQKHNRTDTDYSTVFYFNIAVAVFFYILLFAIAPLIASFYDRPILISIVRVVGLVLVINSFSSVQSAKLTIELNFKAQTQIGIISLVISGFIGVVMAYGGFGVWALVTQGLTGAFVSAVLLWFFSKWIPLKEFSLVSFRQLFSFGSKLLGAGLLDTAYKNIYTLIIGKFFSPKALGLYSRADQFAQFPATNISGIITTVSYPILSSIQNEDERLKYIYIQYIRLSAFVVFPVMMLLAALAYPTVAVLLKSQWLECALYLQLLCFASMWYPIHALNLNLLKVKGRSDLFLRLEIIKKIIGIIMLVITVPLGITAMCIGGIVISIVSLVINTHYTGMLINTGFFKQMKDLLPSLFYSLVMGIMVFFIIKQIDNNFIKLVVGGILGLAFYILVAYITKSTELKTLTVISKENINRFKHKK